MVPAAMTSIDRRSEGWWFWSTTAKAHLNEANAEQPHDHVWRGADQSDGHGIG